ncbi:site-specific integrase [Winogradskyella sp.]|uniref:tyrosine-type recombinase/integrase n=1 Tax=Winogradskyella sp. TaxID=1883156 RepID=UPI0025F3E32B|nr:site-specific integrase [Winogradskyella sp.]
MKSNYSEPKIYTGGVDINQWSKLSRAEQKKALSKHWYVHYRFRNPDTGLLTRQTNIKGGANRYKDRRSRYHILKTLKESLEFLLSEGFSPYEDNTKLIEKLDNKFDAKENLKEEVINSVDYNSNQQVQSQQQDQNIITINDAFELVLTLKKQVMTEDSFIKYRSRINKFKAWLLEKEFTLKTSITDVTKKVVVEYLNQRLIETSARNRNNIRIDLSSFFQTLKDNDVIKENFIKDINKLKTTPVRNKSFTPKQEAQIFKHLEETDKVLLLFIKFICYALLRPIEICRLKVKDVDLEDKKIYVKAKNQPVKIKIIPDFLLKDIPNLEKYNPNNPFFSRDSFGQEWTSKESSRKDYYSKQFKKIKDDFSLGKDYGLYSFRHTYIAKMYNNLSKNHSPHATKSKLMQITGHTSMDGLENYLRSIDAALPEDYSNLLN